MTRPILQKVLSGVDFFHGTGRFQHDFGCNKYQGIVSGVRDSLGEIMNSGLACYPDPLNPDFNSSISITRDVRYALLYSLLYSDENDKETYGVNRLKEWTRVLGNILLEARPFSVEKYIKQRGKRKITPKDYGKWTLSFNPRYNSPFGAFKGMLVGKSDIPGNYPVLLGLGGEINAVEMAGWNEHRVYGTIPRENIKAIFVPERKINDILNEDIPVFPIEDVISK